MRSGIVDVLMGSVVRGYFLVGSPVEKQQREPGQVSSAPVFTLFWTNGFITHFLLLLWEAEEQKGSLEFFVDLVPLQTHIWKVTTSIILVFLGVEF